MPNSPVRPVVKPIQPAQSTTNTLTQSDINNGTLNINVGVAPAKPAEFVEVRISSFDPPK